MKRKKKGQGRVEANDETENDAPEDEVEGGGSACRQKGWWKRGDVETKLNTVNMTAWVHKECNGIEEEVITKLQEAWDSLEQKDECTVRLNDLEGAYWRGTEIGQLGGYGFQGVTLGVDGSCKEGRMGSGLVRRTASPEHADFGGLRSLDALVVVRLVVVPLPPRSPRRRWRVGRFGLIFCWT